MLKPLVALLEGGCGMDAFRSATATLTNLGADQTCVPLLQAAGAPSYVITPVPPPPQPPLTPPAPPRPRPRPRSRPPDLSECARTK